MEERSRNSQSDANILLAVLKSEPLAVLKPESVRHLKHLDRWVRAFMPPAFIIYCVCMFSTAHHWDSSGTLPLSAVESCAN